MTEPAQGIPRMALFEQALDRLAQTLSQSLGGAIAEVAGDLEAAGEFESDSRDRSSLVNSAGLLRAQTAQRIEQIAERLADRASRCIEYANRADDEARALSLLLEDEVDQQILVNDLARAVRGIVAADYLKLSERIHALWPGLWQNDDLNPLGARTVAASAVQGFVVAGATPYTRVQIRRSLLRRLPAVLALALEDIERWLAGREQGSGQRPTPGDAGQAGSRALDHTETAADTARILGSSPLSSAGATPLPVLPTLQPVVELERDAVAFAHAIGVPPYGREARARFFANARDRLQQAKVPAAQLAVVDLVAAMFDYVIDDSRLPESVKPMVWRLQQPTLALAVLDPAYLGDEPRSLRRLIENLGAIANAFADDMGRGGELHRRLETVVRAVEIVAGALQTRSTVMARLVEHEYGRAARNVAQLIDRLVRERSDLESVKARQNRRDYRRRPSREREQEVTVRLSVLLGERLERHRVPESVREFLLNVWLRQLRTAALRDGEESGEFKVAMQVVDDLLWSLDPQTLRGERRELAVKIPPLIHLLTQGVRAIGVKDEELKPFFDELFLIHLRKMQRGDAASGSQRERRGAPPAASTAARQEPGASAVPNARRQDDPDADRLTADSYTGSIDDPFDDTGGSAVDDFDPVTRPAAPRAGSGRTDSPATNVPRPAVPRPTGKNDIGSDTATDIGSDTGADTGTDDLDTPAFPSGPLPDTMAQSAPAAPVPPSREAELIRGAEEEAASGAPGQRLLEVLSSLDLGDLPAQPSIVPMLGANPVERLARGKWIQLYARDGTTSYAKVAWINARRTVVLLVRHPDRRALSLRATEVVERFAQGRAFLIE